MVKQMGAHRIAGSKPQKRTSILKLLRDFPEVGPATPPAPINEGHLLDLRTARAKCRDWVRRIEEEHRTRTAAQFTSAALKALAVELEVNLTANAEPPDHELKLDKEATGLASSIGREAAALPRVEALHFITSLYPALLSQETRGGLGAFYTPPALTSRLVDLLSEHGADWSTARVLDPAAGAGAFMLQIALRIVSALDDAEPAFILRQLATRLRGFEIDPNAARLGQAALEILLSDFVRAAGQQAPEFIRVCDSLEENPAEQFDVVVGNPPYGRITLTSEQRLRFARSLYGHANLYGVFTDLAVRWTKPGGLIAYLTPTSFLAGQYFAALRQLLGTEAPPLSIDLVHARKGVFEDVLQETLLAVYRKGATRSRVQIHYLNVRSSVDAVVKKNGTIKVPASVNDPWLAPRSPEHGPLIARAERMPSRLKDWGYFVSTGPLVWNRFKSQLCSDATSDALPLVWAECVLPDGSFELRARKRNHTPFFRVLLGDDWLIVRQPCVLVQRTTAKEQPRRLVAAELPAALIEAHGGVVVENHLNMVRADQTAVVDSAVVAALLNSEVVDQLFRCMSGSVAVSAFELEALPLPDTQNLGKLSALVRNGAVRAEIETECARLYSGVHDG